MGKWLETMTDAAWRERMGRRFEGLTDEVFHVVRWATIVGFVRYLEVEYGAVQFTVTRWVLSFFLFGYIASRFLLRPELDLFPGTRSQLLLALRLMVNFAICFLVFGLVLWAIDALSAAVANYRALR